MTNNTLNSKSSQPYILRSLFLTTPTSFNTITIILKDGSLDWISQNGAHTTIPLDFSISFQVIDCPLQDSPNSTPDERLYSSIGRAKACLAIYRQNSQLIRGYCYTDIITSWELELSRRLTQKGFKRYFKVVKKIGKGNYGTVYLCKSIKDQRLVAAKVFKKEIYEKDEKQRKALENEIKIMRAVSSPYLVKLEGVMESANTVYLLMEYIDGLSLYDRLNNPNIGRMPQQQIKSLLRCLLKGLQAMSLKNIIHRDLKPENILLRSNNKNPVIIDMGLSTRADEKTYIFTRCGTPGYVSPQVINAKDTNQKCTPVSDMYGLGSIFYEIYLGKHLFEGKDLHEIIRNNMAADISSTASGLIEMIDADAKDLLMKMLTKDPSQRISARDALFHPYLFQKSKLNKSFSVRTTKTMERSRQLQTAKDKQSIVPMKSFVALCRSSNYSTTNKRMFGVV